MIPKIRYPFEGKYPITFKFGDGSKWYVDIAGYPHNGIDFGLPVGVPILACDKGYLTYADNVPDSDGLGINMKHSWGLSQYWHLSKLTAILGQSVEKGELLGYSGATGWATGPHLHFGIKIHGDSPPGMRGWTNPMKCFEEAIAPPVAPTPEKRFYRVKWGDSLWKIAEKFYGKGYHWPLIYKANMRIIKNPQIIHVFQRLHIP